MKIEEDITTIKKSSIDTHSPEALIPSYFEKKTKSIIKINTKPIMKQESDLTIEAYMQNKFKWANHDSKVIKAQEKEINIVNMGGFIN
jgi:hypothetical protein